MLMRLCALYLTRQPSIRIDPVARFDLGNGARLERINWLGNNSPRGIRESFGIMVNYLYDRDTIEDNHKAFVRGTKEWTSAAKGASLSPCRDKGRLAPYSAIGAACFIEDFAYDIRGERTGLEVVP